MSQLVVALCSFLMLLTLSILIYRFIKAKMGWKLAGRHIKLYMLLVISLLDMLMFMNFFFNWSRNIIIKSSYFMAIRVLLNIATYMIIVFVFKKASRGFKNRKRWINRIRLLFGIGMVVNVVNAIY